MEYNSRPNIINKMTDINIHLDNFGDITVSGSDIMNILYKLYPTSSFSIIGIKPQLCYVGTSSYNNSTDTLSYSLNDNSYYTLINNDKQTLITKNGLAKKTIQKNNRTEIVDVQTDSKYPFSIELEHSGSDNAYLKFSRSDGNLKPEIYSNLLQSNKFYHFVCQKTGSQLEIYIDGILISTGSDYSNIPFNIIGSIGDTHNECDTFIGSLGGYSKMYSGSIDELKIYNKALNTNQVSVLANNELSGSYDYVVGNVFYDYGILTINEPTLIP